METKGIPMALMTAKAMNLPLVIIRKDMILTDWEGIWMEKWFVAMKKADFNGIAEKYQISPIIARLMRNRDVIGDEAIDFYLNGTVEDLYDGLLMKDMDRAVDILKEKIEEGKKIRVWRTGDTEYTETKFYHVEREGEVDLKNLAENALQKANVQLVKGVLPYQFNEMKDFNMGYLSGFMAEKRDIEQKAVEGNMQATMKNSAEKLMRESVQGYNALSVNSFGVIPKKEDWSYALLPVWTVTYKGKDGKIYYYSMNGQTGKVFGELPVDYGKVTLTGIISAVVVLIIALIGGYFL